ncbi:hypothetical protein EXIGLDRAFT_354300 [Exidia glandulosa HHB12029]|uniref:Uncharacterized protein n=1 Tax=Exidia glandulosa HHB12029 TaxID=1314781 RepID=A0A165CBW2_EXIGL|nr:hypothetical protein EXIGLDRAFT_354300 [Exidia glandulosa HHB12029]
MLCENFPKEQSRYSHPDATSCLVSTTDLLPFGYTPWELRAARTSHKYPSPLPDMELLCAPIVVIFSIAPRSLLCTPSTPRTRWGLGGLSFGYLCPVNLDEPRSLADRFLTCDIAPIFCPRPPLPYTIAAFLRTRCAGNAG